MDRTKISSIKAYSRPYRYGYVAQLNVQAFCSNAHAYRVRAAERNISLLHCCVCVCVRAVVHSLLCSLARSFSLFLHFSVFFACSLSLLPSRSLYRSTSLFLSLFVMHPPKLTMAGIRHARNSNTTANRCQSVHIHVCYAS